MQATRVHSCEFQAAVSVSLSSGFKICRAFCLKLLDTDHFHLQMLTLRGRNSIGNHIVKVLEKKLVVGVLVLVCLVGEGIRKLFQLMVMVYDKVFYKSLSCKVKRSSVSGFFCGCVPPFHYDFARSTCCDFIPLSGNFLCFSLVTISRNPKSTASYCTASRHPRG